MRLGVPSCPSPVDRFTCWTHIRSGDEVTDNPSVNAHKKPRGDERQNYNWWSEANNKDFFLHSWAFSGHFLKVVSLNQEGQCMIVCVCECVCVLIIGKRLKIGLEIQPGTSKLIALEKVFFYWDFISSAQWNKPSPPNECVVHNLRPNVASGRNAQIHKQNDAHINSGWTHLQSLRMEDLNQTRKM